MSTMTIKRDARVMRAYVWLWGADPHAANFCKLFWALVFSPLALFVLKPLRFVFRRPATGEGLERIERFVTVKHPGVGRFIANAFLVVCFGWLAFIVVFGFIKQPLVMAGAITAALLVARLVGWVVRKRSSSIKKFAAFLATGYRAVKTRTCPKVEVR